MAPCICMPTAAPAVLDAPAPALDARLDALLVSEAILVSEAELSVAELKVVLREIVLPVPDADGAVRTGAEVM